MNKTKATLTVLAGGFVLFILGALREVVDPVAAAREGSMMPRAVAANACDIPKLDELARTWKVVGTECKDCNRDHASVGDTLTFAKNLSGESEFSLEVKPGKSGLRPFRTEGYTLRADGVGNVSGPIVMPHSVLDGSPLQLHWLIVKVRKYDADGLGQCKLVGRVSICTDEPAPGASSCTSRQHDGALIIQP